MQSHLERNPDSPLQEKHGKQARAPPVKPQDATTEQVGGSSASSTQSRSPQYDHHPQHFNDHHPRAQTVEEYMAQQQAHASNTSHRFEQAGGSSSSTSYPAADSADNRMPSGMGGARVEAV